MKARVNNLVRDYRNVMILSFEVEQESAYEAKRIFDHEKGLLSVSVKEWKDKRTLTANAYFHVLVNKLATAMRIANDECKVYLVKSYGTVAERNGTPVTITLPKGVKSEDFYPYCEWIAGDADGDTYQLYKQTHVMDTKEFARLLDGTIAECKEQNIETLPPEEIARLYAQADKTH